MWWTKLHDLGCAWATDTEIRTSASLQDVNHHIMPSQGVKLARNGDTIFKFQGRGTFNKTKRSVQLGELTRHFDEWVLQVYVSGHYRCM